MSKYTEGPWYQDNLHVREEEVDDVVRRQGICLCELEAEVHGYDVTLEKVCAQRDYEKSRADGLAAENERLRSLVREAAPKCHISTCLEIAVWKGIGRL